MKKILTVPMILLISVTILNAQKEYNKWYFGNNAGLNFNTKPPTILKDGKMFTMESSTSICDSNGQLLFYTSGDSLYNRKHQLMRNWESEKLFARVMSSMQGSMALPVPGSNRLYYLFLGLSSENWYANNKDSMMYYWIIDMSGDGGFGEVVVKDQPLLLARRESFAITINANGSDYWIAAVDAVNSQFNCIRTTKGFFSTPVITQKINQSLLPITNTKFSPDSRIFFSSQSYKNAIGNPLFMNLYKFDNTSGQLSQHRLIYAGDGTITRYGYYMEFSPDSRFFYIAFNEDYNSKLYQYDVSVWDSAAIASSKQLIYTLKNNRFSGFQLGPDGKIYCFKVGGKKLSVINNPNLKGGGCNFNFEAIDLISNWSGSSGGPYYPSFWWRTRTINLGKDTIICAGDSINIFCNTAPNNKIVWNTGDTTKTLLIKQSGKYSVKVTIPGGTILHDTIIVKTGPKFQVFIGNDTAFCGKFSHLIRANSGFARYHWNTGAIAMQITVNSKGIYSVKVLDSNTCPSGDSLTIDEIPKPIIKLSYDSVTCQHVYLSTDSLKGLTYLWNTGEKTKNIKVSNKGWYIITASHQFCSNVDSIFLNKLSMPDPNLGPDSSLCINAIELRTNESGQFIWNTLETRPAIIISTIGKYWLTISRNNCTSTDTINIQPCEDMTYYIPDIFTPNGDNINDIFSVEGSNIKQIEMEIYNRWGEQLFKEVGKSPYWDGTYKNETCMESVYFYRVKLKGKKVDGARYIKGSILLAN